MDQQFDKSRPPSFLSWPERILVAVAVILILILGFAVGLVVLGLVTVVAAGAVARLWWVRRRLKRGAQRRGRVVVDAEYEVLERRKSGGPPKDGRF